jgi:hypothetical protein
MHHRPILDDKAISDEETLNAFFRAFLREVEVVYPDYRLRGALQDGWQPAHKALQAICPQVVLGESAISTPNAGCLRPWLSTTRSTLRCPQPCYRRCRPNTTMSWRRRGYSLSPSGCGDGPNSSDRIVCSRSALRRCSARSCGSRPGPRSPCPRLRLRWISSSSGWTKSCSSRKPCVKVIRPLT